MNQIAVPFTVLFALAFLATTAGLASSTNIAATNGDDAPVYVANNQYHWFAYAPTAGPDIVGGYEDARLNNYAPTDLFTSFHGTGVADSTDWDVYVEKCYGCMSYVALSECRVFYAPTPEFHSCSHWHIMNNGQYTDGYTAAGMHQLGCHEIGHTVGLMHPRDGSQNEGIYGCMVSGVPVDGFGHKRSLRQHNIDHINGLY